MVRMNYVDLLERCPLPDFADALRDEPEDLLACLGLALCLVRAGRYPALSPQRIIVRIQGVQPLTAMRTLKANAIGTSYALPPLRGCEAFVPGWCARDTHAARTHTRDRQAGDDQGQRGAGGGRAATRQAYGLCVRQVWHHSDVPVCGRQV